MSILLFSVGFFTLLVGLVGLGFNGGWNLWLTVGIFTFPGSGLVWIYYLISSPDARVKLRRREFKSSQPIKVSKVSSDLPLKDNCKSEFCRKCGLAIESSDLECKNCGKKVVS